MDKEVLNNLRIQIEEQLINLQYTRESHIKCSHRLQKTARILGCLQIVLSAVSTAELISILISNNKVATIISTVCSALLFAISTYIKDKDLLTESRKHIETAEQLFSLREKYKTMLATYKEKSINEIEETINNYVEKTESIYKIAPAFSPRDYKKASVDIKEGKISISERDKELLLPKFDDNDDAK